MTADVFGTRAVRERVLETWRTDPARLREDANTEEDHARGYYRDRVVVELAQNAADAAARGGVPGRLLLRLTGTDDAPAGSAGAGGGVAVLVAANTGVPVDAAGIASMAAMRVSSSRDWAEGGSEGRGAATSTGSSEGAQLVGRFGVGFAAVRAVADTVTVATVTGAVRFSTAATEAAIAGLGVPALTEELRRRAGSVPALRLPAPDGAPTEPGYDTTVRLVLRDAAAVAEVRRMLAEVGDPLLLALPALDEIVIEDDLDGGRRRIAGVDRRWRRITATGELSEDLTADRPVEERTRRGWRITWAVPRSRDGGETGTWGEPGTPGEPDGPGARVELPRVVHAPTPTDDPLSVPALLVATLPLDPTRRHVARGPATAALLDLAAELYARLAEQVARDGGDALALVPVGLAAGPLDAELHERIVDRLAGAEILPVHARSGSAVPQPELVAPDRAVALSDRADPALTAALSTWFAGLVAVPPGRTAAARMLGVPLRATADLVDELPAVPGDPRDFRRLYAALAELTVDPRDREGLSALPVPLADGGMARGARGLLLPHGADRTVRHAASALRDWGLRLVHPQAAHEVLERLGAVTAGPAELLAHPGLRQAVLDTAAEDDPLPAEQVAAAALDLLAAAGPDPEDDRPLPPERVVLGLLTLRDADGESAPAHGLVLPGSTAAELLDARVLGEVSGAQVNRWGPAVLTAAGVRADLVVLRVPDQVAATVRDELPGDEAVEIVVDQLDGWEEYLEFLAGRWGEQTSAAELLAVADLDAVHPDRWPAALARIAAPGTTRRALLDPAVPLDVAAVPAPGYTAWWLRTRSGLIDGPFAAVGAQPQVSVLLPPPPGPVAELDVAAQRALGGVLRLAEVPGPDWAAMLADLGRSGDPVDPAVARAVWTAWGDRAAAGPAADAPQDAASQALADLDLLPARVAGARVRLVPAEQAAVAPEPMWQQRTDIAAMVPVPAGVPADQLAELLDLPLASELVDGLVEQEDDLAVMDTPPEVLALLPAAPAAWWEHDELRVDGVGVDWWVEGSGPRARVHAVHLAGLARALAQAAGAWPSRHAVELLLTDPDRAAELALEAASDPLEGDG